MTDQNTCPHCKGEKGANCHHNTGTDSSKHYWAWVDCSLCNGTGTVVNEVIKRIKLGKLLAAARRSSGMTLAETRKLFNTSSAKISAVETGRADHSTIPSFYDCLIGEAAALNLMSKRFQTACFLTKNCNETASAANKAANQESVSNNGREVINLTAGLTHCKKCGSIHFAHRPGCACNETLDQVTVEHGYLIDKKREMGSTLCLDDFFSCEKIIQHVENDTADVFIDGEIVTADMCKAG